MKTLVLGGTFNPVHIGHLMLVENIAYEFGYEKIILVPSFIPPHKVDFPEPGAQKRLEMLKIAVNGNDLYSVEECELNRKGLSYTIDTIRYLIMKYDLKTKLGFVIGDDLVDGFCKWKSPSEICNLAQLILARRNNEVLPDFSFPHKNAKNIILPISSSDIRKRISEKKPWKWLVPKEVASYIEKENLYKE